MVEKNRGFSLVEILVVTGIVGVIILAVSSMFINFSKMMAQLEAKQEILSLTSEIQTNIATQASCEAALGVSSPGSIVKFNANKAGQQEPSAGYPVSMNVNGTVLSAGTEIPQRFINVNYLNMSEARNLGNDSLGQTLYSVVLNGSFSTTKSVLGTAQTKNTRIGGFLIKVDGSNNIQSCFTLSSHDPNSLGQLAEALCPLFGGTVQSGTCKLPSGGGGGSCLPGMQTMVKGCLHICNGGSWQPAWTGPPCP